MQIFESMRPFSFILPQALRELSSCFEACPLVQDYFLTLDPELGFKAVLHAGLS